MTSELAPDVVIMDIDMPDLNGVDATRQVTAAGSTKVIALSCHSDGKFVKEMLKAGAKGYVVKQAAFQELIAALRSVVANNTYLSPMVAGLVVEDLAREGTAHDSSVFGKLSAREREVLQLVAEGKATKEVAAHLQVSVKTVETHRRNIMEKLDMTNVAELTKYAIREGITTLDA
jgi:two-component system response regulator NreC